VKAWKPKGIVTFLEDVSILKSALYGVKRGAPDTKTIAYQHANITPMKLWYSYSPEEISLEGDYIKGMPVPDYFIFQGRMGKNIVKTSGYPESRCFMTGSPRFDGLAGIKKEIIDVDLPKDKKDNTGSYHLFRNRF